MRLRIRRAEFPCRGPTGVCVHAPSPSVLTNHIINSETNRVEPTFVLWRFVVLIVVLILRLLSQDGLNYSASTLIWYKSLDFSSVPDFPYPLAILAWSLPLALPIIHAGRDRRQV